MLDLAASVTAYHHPKDSEIERVAIRSSINSNRHLAAINREARDRFGNGVLAGMPCISDHFGPTISWSEGHSPNRQIDFESLQHLTVLLQVDFAIQGAPRGMLSRT